jgi:hypothetical protein
MLCMLLAHYVAAAAAADAAAAAVTCCCALSLSLGMSRLTVIDRTVLVTRSRAITSYMA